MKRRINTCGTAQPRALLFIQAVVLAEFDGLNVPNAYGHLPLANNDPAKPNDAYFQHVDYVVDKAHELGLYVGMLPTWGDKWNKKWGVGPEVFTQTNAEQFGEFLGNRYKESPIIWILGGDRNPESDAHLAIVRALAKGLRKGDGGNHLMTYHPIALYFLSSTTGDCSAALTSSKKRRTVSY